MIGLIRPTRFALIARLTLALLVCIAAPVRRAHAQPPPPTEPQQQPQPEPQRVTEQPEGPFDNVFRRQRARREGSQTLTFTLGGYGGYDSKPIAEQAGVTQDPLAQFGGGSAFIGADAGLDYFKTGHRASYALNVNGSRRYFPSSSALSTSAATAGAGLQYQVARRTIFRVDEAIEYQPYYQLGVFPGFGDPDLGAALGSNLDFAVLKDQSLLSVTSASLEQGLSRRSTISLTGSYASQTFQNSKGTTNSGSTGDLHGYTVGVRFRRQLTRNLGLHLGDEYIEYLYASPTHLTFRSNNIDVGLDYSRSLAFSRHTTFSFHTGSTIVRYGGQQFADVIGSADLTHLFTRNWQTRLSYNRNLTFLQSLNQPIFADAASAELLGTIRRNWLLSITGGYLSGQFGLRSDSTKNSTMRTGTGELSLTYAFNTVVRANFSYSYFSYYFSRDLLLPAHLRPSFDRNTVRAGLILVLPLLH